MSAGGFEAALQRLVDDPEFAKAVEQDQNALTDVYLLTQQELDVLASIYNTAHPGGTGAMVVVACYVHCKSTA